MTNVTATRKLNWALSTRQLTRLQTHSCNETLQSQTDPSSSLAFRVFFSFVAMGVFAPDNGFSANHTLNSISPLLAPRGDRTFLSHTQPQPQHIAPSSTNNCTNFAWFALVLRSTVGGWKPLPRRRASPRVVNLGRSARRPLILVRSIIHNLTESWGSLQLYELLRSLLTQVKARESKEKRFVHYYLSALNYIEVMPLLFFIWQDMS